MTRPFLLDPLFAPLQRLHGIGPRISKLLETLAGPCVIDLLFHWPHTAIDRRQVRKIGDIEPGVVNTVVARVTMLALGQQPGRPSRVWLGDGTGELALVFFKNPGGYLQKNFPLGKEVAVSGRIELYQGKPQMPHPDKITSGDKVADIAGLEPVYPLTAGLTNSVLVKAEQLALNRVPHLPEWLDAEFIKQQNFPAWNDALQDVHGARGTLPLSPNDPPRRRLAYDEILSHQLALALTRQMQKRQSSEPLQPDPALKEKALAILPFALTDGQKAVLQDIEADLRQPFQMCRLLQGDVGSGKTIVAFLAAVHVIGAKKQAALMAPTEIVARQHLRTLLPLAEQLGIRIALLTAREKGKAREKILADLHQGNIDLLIGTHALIQEPVQFFNLGLAIADEQHRFGVGQRLALAAKGQAVNILVMTATPIPRTLALTAYGDMDSSVLKEKPPGRKPIDTRVLPMARMAEIIAGLQRKISDGERIYWVCPLVEESELVDLTAVTDRYNELARHFPGRVGIVHGRLKGDEKDSVMARFAAGEIDILVATTVIEVGVHVDAATVMIVEHAERFGLSQLHQLRGRVGRGDKGGTCLLLYDAPIGQIAKQRLQAMRDTEDGFALAEMDLQLRGPGDILGLKQSGDAVFRLATLEAHGDLLYTASQEAKLILQRDPDLISERGKALRILLYLFERDRAQQLLSAG